MKKFLFWATVVGASLTSCVNDNEVVQTAEDNPQTVTFEVAKYKPSSRADGNSQTATDGSDSHGHVAFSTQETFGTFAWEANGHGATHTPFMENTKISYVGNVWVGTDKPYFWPSEKTAHIDFISYYPYGTVGTDAWVPTITESKQGNADYNKLYYSNYTVDGKDLMFSDKAHLQTTNHETHYTMGVPTLFRHALAKLNFMVASKYSTTTDGGQTTYWNVKVNSITIGNIRNKGSITFVTDAPLQGSTAMTSEWRIENLDKDDPKVWNFAAGYAPVQTWTRSNGHVLPALDPSKANGGYEIFGEGTGKAENFMILPQSIEEAGQYINIVYTISSRASLTGDWKNEELFDKTFTFYELIKKGTSVSNWEMGKNIIYKILIDPKGDLINFDPAVVEWETIDGGAIGA